MNEGQDEQGSPIADRRTNGGDRRQNVDEILNVLGRATQEAQTLSQRVNNLDKNTKTNTRMQVFQLALIAMLVVVFFQLSDVADKNRETLSKVDQALVILNECTTDSPAKASPPRKPINKEDIVHECREQGYTNQAGAVDGLRDTNKNKTPDNLEILQLLDDIKKELKE